VVVAVFVMTRILPGDPAAVMAGGHATPAVLQALRKQMGLDQPLPVQLWTYVVNLLHGDLGTSVVTGHAVLQDLLQRLPATIELSLYSLLIAILVSIPLGVAAAVNRGGWIDRAVQQVAILGASTPLFWLGVVLIFIFYVKLGIAPSPVGRLATGVQPPPTITGLYTIDSILTLNGSALASAAGHLVLPVVALSFVVMAPLIKMARDSMSAVLDSDFIQADYSFGLPPRQIIWQDGLKNTLISLLTVVGIVLGYLMAGNVIVETIFSWPGIGQYAWNGINSADYMAVQGFVLVVAIIYVGMNLVIDLLYMFIDPRVRLA
jgi:peptide/nickel transport system permease protein